MSCDKGSCSSPHSNSSCHCDCHKGCGCSCHNKSQGAEGECCVSDPLIQLADQAWMELMKEKIKAQFQASSGSKMDGVAKVLASACGAKWQLKMATKQHRDDYKKNLSEAFQKHSK